MNEELHEQLVFEMVRKKNWFCDYYTIHEQKYTRLIALGIDVDANSIALAKLYTDAERVRAEIQSLELRIANLEKEMQGEESND